MGWMGWGGWKTRWLEVELGGTGLDAVSEEGSVDGYGNAAIGGEGKVWVRTSACNRSPIPRDEDIWHWKFGLELQHIRGNGPSGIVAEDAANWLLHLVPVLTPSTQPGFAA